MNTAVKEKETFWSRFADYFETKNNYVVGIKEIEHIKERLAKETNLGKALELGCGDGVYSKILIQNSDSLIATDWSDEMIAVAESKLSKHDHVTVQKENCFELSFPDNSFDTVFMANLLHIIPTPEKALRECKRVLKPNGKLIMLSFTAHGMGLFNKIGMIYRYFKTYGKPPEQSRVLTPENVKDMFETENFKTLEVSLIGKKMKVVYGKAQK